MHVGGVTWTDNIRGWDTEIIDEAQASYQFTSLWNDLIKLIEPGYGIFIVLFSSYESPLCGSLEAKTQPLISNRVKGL